MPDEKRDVTRFTKYFGIRLPSVNVLTVLIILIGIASGILGELILSNSLPVISLLLYGSSIGITLISFPAILTALLLKVMKRTLKLKHAMVAVIVITLTYAAFFIISAFTYELTKSYAVAYIPILLSSAGPMSFLCICDFKLMCEAPNRSLSFLSSERALATSFMAAV